MTSDPLGRLDFSPYLAAVTGAETVVPEGRVTQVIGLIAEGDSLGLGVGGLASIINNQGQTIKAEVVGFREEKALFMPYGDIRGSPWAAGYFRCPPLPWWRSPMVFWAG